MNAPRKLTDDELLDKALHDVVKIVGQKWENVVHVIALVSSRVICFNDETWMEVGVDIKAKTLPTIPYPEPSVAHVAHIMTQYPKESPGWYWCRAFCSALKQNLTLG